MAGLVGLVVGVFWQLVIKLLVRLLRRTVISRDEQANTSWTSSNRQVLVKIVLVGLRDDETRAQRQRVHEFVKRQQRLRVLVAQQPWEQPHIDSFSDGHGSD